ncbi:MAG: hypothetical protein ACRCU5_10555 [Rhizobiaceae bacterium]
MRRQFNLGFKRLLIIFGISAAITMGAPSTVSVAAITFIGIPIAIYLAVAPFLFLVTLGTWLVSKFFGRSSVGILLSFAATLVALAIPPYLANMRLDGISKAQVAADLDLGTKPKAKTIAVRSTRFWGRSKDVAYCDGFCQRALINGVAERVLVVEQDLNLAIDPALMVDSFRLEKRSSCPAVKLPQGYDPIEIAGDRPDFKAKRVDELMQLEIAKGNCLIAETAPLGMADIVLSVGRVFSGGGTIGAGLSLLADTVSADRIALHERKGDAYEETYRKTFVVTYKLAPLYAPTVEGGSELRMHAALARVRDTINIDNKYYEKPDWTAFLTGRLGLDLALRPGNAEAETRTVLKDAILRTGEAQAVPAQVAEDFFMEVNNKRMITGDDLAIARQLLEDERFPVSTWAASAIREAKDAPQEYFDAVAVAMFKRLRSHADKGTVKTGSPWHEDLSAIGSVIGVLPGETIRKHRADLDWLSRQDGVRVQAYLALSRYAEFGADGVEPLIWLIDDSQRFREAKDNDWQHPHLAGLIGLCKLGADGASAIQPLFDRLDKGQIANWASYHRLVVHTLSRMGAKPEDIWLHAREKGSGVEKDEVKLRKRLDREIQRALKREECWY